MSNVVSFQKYMENAYRDKLLHQLNVEPILIKIMREEAELKEKMIRDTLHPFRRWLVNRTKWRWLVSGYRFEQHFTGEKLIMRLYRGTKLLRHEEIDRRPITFRKWQP